MSHSKDWVAHWFTLYKEHGEFTDILIGIKDKSENIQWDYFQHEREDGLSSLEQSINIIIPKKAMNTSLFKYFFGIIKYIRHSKIHKTEWKNYNNDHLQQREKRLPQTLSFTESDFLKLKRSSTKLNISINTLLIGAIDRVVRIKLLTPNTSLTYWFIPYNMRGGVKENKNSNNYSSHTIAIIKKNYSLNDIKHSLKKMLLSNYHLGAWAFLNIGKIIGISGTKFLMNHLYNSNHSWCGSISNLGNFKIDNFSKTIYFCPPATRPYPIAVGAITVNNKLTLSFIFHPVLNLDENLINDILQNVRAELEQL